MSAVLVAVCAFALFAIAYFTYGSFLRTRVLGLDTDAPTPAVRFEDGVDYVPSNRFVLFGHHFASIAGLGPIVGPALAVIWGLGPALAWIVLGSIFIGAVHDFAALAISLRHDGKSIGDLTGEIVGKRARLLFLVIIFFLLALAMGVFALVIAVMFVQLHPEAVIPVFGLMLIAMFLGTAVYRYRFGLGLMTAIGLLAMFGTIVLGVRYPVAIYQWHLPVQLRADIANVASVQGKVLVLEPGTASHELSRHDVVSMAEARRIREVAAEEGSVQPKLLTIDLHKPEPAAAYFESFGRDKAATTIRKAGAWAMSAWTWVLLCYAFVASVLPVWLLLQPRDYLNSFKLYLGLGLMMAGMLVLGPVVQAPWYNSAANTEMPIFPFLFITIACGAVSGFHSLVSSGTTARQLARESDAQLIGFGAMLVEGALAVLVVLACTAGLGSAAEWKARYGSFASMNKLGPKVSAVIDGGGYFVSGVGVPIDYARAFIAVMVVAFAMTTLDSATRLLRYNVEELGKTTGVPLLHNRYIASLIACVAIGYFAFFRIGDQPAGLVLWQLFGSTNQLLAGLGLLLVAVWLVKRNKSVAPVLAPMLLMFAVTLTAMSMTMAGTVSRTALAEQSRVVEGLERAGEPAQAVEVGQPLDGATTVRYAARALVSGRADRGEVTLLVVSLVVLVLALWLVVEACLAWRRHAGAGGQAPPDEEPPPGAPGDGAGQDLPAGDTPGA